MRTFCLVSSIALACVAQQSFPQGQFPENPSLRAFSGYGAGDRFTNLRTGFRSANSAFGNQKSFNFRPTQQVGRSQQGFVSARPVQVAEPARALGRSAYIPVGGRGYAQRHTSRAQEIAQPQYEVQQQVEEPQFEVQQQVQQQQFEVQQPQFEVQQEIQRPRVQYQRQIQRPQFVAQRQVQQQPRFEIQTVQQPQYEVREQIQERRVQIQQQPQVQIQQRVVQQPQFRVQQQQQNDEYVTYTNDVQVEQPRQYQPQQVQYRTQRVQYETQPLQQVRVQRVQRVQLQAPLIEQRAQVVQDPVQQVQVTSGNAGQVHEIHTADGPRNLHVEEIRSGDQVIRVHDSAPKQPIVHNIQTQDDPVLVRLVSKSEGPAHIERVVHQQGDSEVFDVVNPAPPAEQVVHIDRAPATPPQIVREEVVEQQQPVQVQQVQQRVHQVVHQAPAVATQYAVATPVYASSVGTGARTVSLVGSGLSGRQYQTTGPLQVVSHASQYSAPIGAAQFTNRGSNTFGTTVVLNKKKSS